MSALREAPPLSLEQALEALEELALAGPRAALPRFIGKLEELQEVLRAHLYAPPAKDRLVEAAEAAELLGISERSLYDHADEFDFTVRENHRKVRFSELGIQRYLSRKRGDGGRRG